METSVFSVLAVVGILVALLAWYRWDSASNRGYQHGYFGEFNRVSNALAPIPGVMITQAWHNLDITLEEFGFGITVTGQPIRLSFGEADSIRNLPRDAVVDALKKRIDIER